jgi:hypothetical protein
MDAIAGAGAIPFRWGQEEAGRGSMTYDLRIWVASQCFPMNHPSEVIG